MIDDIYSALAVLAGVFGAAAALAGLLMRRVSRGLKK